MKTVDFHEYNLEDLECKNRYGSVDGPFGSNLPASSYKENGVPIIRGANLSLGKERFVDCNYKFINEELAIKLKRSSCQPNDIVFTKKGTLGQTGLVPLNSEFKHFILSSNQMRIRLNEAIANPLYVYYFVSCPQSQNRILADAMTAGVPKINLTYLRKFKILLPNITIQKKIAATLSAYDDIVENNKRRIALLEKMAEEIYREWFVRFRFPGNQTAEFEKGIPKGWHIDKAEAFFSHIKGKSYKGDELSENLESSIPFVTLKSFQRGGGYREEGLKYYTGAFRKQQVVYEGDVVMAVTDMTQERVVVGRVARVPEIGAKGAVISLDVIKLVPKTISSTFLYCYMKYSGFGDFIKSFANGANVLHLKADLVTQQVIVIPPIDLREKFDEIAGPMHKQIEYLRKKNKNLMETKNMLLPRLISGKLSVENLNIQFPPSMQEESAT